MIFSVSFFLCSAPFLQLAFMGHSVENDDDIQHIEDDLKTFNPTNFFPSISDHLVLLCLHVDAGMKRRGPITINNKNTKKNTDPKVFCCVLLVGKKRIYLFCLPSRDRRLWLLKHNICWRYKIHLFSVAIEGTFYWKFHRGFNLKIQ